MALSHADASALWRAQGYTVESADAPIGTVEDTVAIPGMRLPTALAVRLDAAELHVVLVPITDIAAVDVRRRTITLTANPKLTDRVPAGRLRRSAA